MHRLGKNLILEFPRDLRKGDDKISSMRKPDLKLSIKSDRKLPSKVLNNKASLPTFLSVIKLMHGILPALFKCRFSSPGSLSLDQRFALNEGIHSMYTGLALCLWELNSQNKENAIAPILKLKLKSSTIFCHILGTHGLPKLLCFFLQFSNSI